MSDAKIYWLVFGESETYYLARWFRRGFGHVHAIACIEGYWTLFDPAIHSLVVNVLGESEGVDFIKHYAEQNPTHTFLKVQVFDNPDMPVWRVGPISCVSVIQYLLGVYWPLTVTPYQLYFRLITHTPGHIRILADERI